jgi:hypothetical protein
MDETSKTPGIPILIDESTPRIADPACGIKTDDWQPANVLTIKLVCCLEAIRDLKPICGILALSSDPGSDRRLVKTLATPLYSLAMGIHDLFGEVEHSELKAMPMQTQRAFRNRVADFTQSVLGGKDGPLKKVRDKIGAHIDKDTILGGQDLWASVDLTFYVTILRLCMNELDHFLRLDNYAWLRRSDCPNRVRLMNIDGTLVDLAGDNGELKSIVAVSYVKSPRFGIVGELNELVGVVNVIVLALSSAQTCR